MAYLYAEPVARMTSEGVLEACDTPLDIEGEYLNVVNNLKATGKEFRILREAINFPSLQQIIMKKPKIIHISTHGAFDAERNEFYLAIEDVGNGLEDKFTQDRLQKLLGISQTPDRPTHDIKLAFVSACQSEEIGKIFLEAGIPIVISVNSEQNIMDQVCNIFSQQFYRNLLDGNTIRDSFYSAQEFVQVSKENFETCCCAHKHKDDCVWYKYYLKDWRAAHDLHKQTCKCNYKGVNGSRQHKKTCELFQNFVNFLSELKKEQAPKKESDLNAGLLGLTMNDLEDSDAFDDDFITEMQNDVIVLDQQQD